MTEGVGHHIAVVGAALSANKGAASMLRAIVDNVDEVLPGGRVINLSTYPTEDREYKRSGRLEIASLTPVQMLFPVLPLALLIWIVRHLGMSGRRLALTSSLRALMDADVVADVAGISFVDGRGIPTLLYNILTTGIPLLVGAPTVKCSQAMGPFRNLSTRTAARAILPHCETIVARGPRTREHLEDLGLSNVVEGADLAFLMKIDEAERTEARCVLEDLHDEEYVVMCPSSVVRALCDAKGIDYVKLIGDVIGEIGEKTDCRIVIMAHSARPGHLGGRMNDIPVCEEIYDAVRGQAKVALITESLNAATLRTIIGGAKVLITSRFHAMISGLATLTPTVVVGWSHKYAEVMSEFGLAELVVPYSALTSNQVTKLVFELLEAEESTRAQIRSRLGPVAQSSRESLLALGRTING